MVHFQGSQVKLWLKTSFDNIILDDNNIEISDNSFLDESNLNDFKETLIGLSNVLQIEIVFDKSYLGNVDIKVFRNTIQAEIKDAEAWPKMEKQVRLTDKNFDATLMAYQYEKDLVRIIER